MASLESREVRATFSPGTTGTPVEEQRRGWEEAVSGVILPSTITITAVDVAGIPSEWVASSAQPAGDTVVLYVHGGGFTAGSPKTHRELAARLVEASGSRLLVIDYRLAPESRCPAAVDDVVTAYRWLLDTGLAPQQIAFAGESSGAALIMAALVQLREAGAPLPAAVALISPWVDLTMSGPTIESRAEVDPLTTKAGLTEASRYYLGDRDPGDPMASPLFADLQSLPPTLIHVGDHEILLSDSLQLAEKLRAAGVDVQLDIWDEMWHVWHGWAAAVPEARQAIVQIGQFLRERLAAVAR
ncbi:MAG TPA: alpha/beta hydrolase [Herpetosiphonaceae bacterium]